MDGHSLIGTKREDHVNPLLLSPRDAARALSVCGKTLYNLREAGEIRAVRIGRAVRYSVEELQAWIERASEKKCAENENGS
ncbi:MAG: helix-turn-helix domain-containing protein [Sedimentisphaerales bacterium]|nr:helix-turn-helix domain-containing protein [Sedimentisphaerales bacterium]